ACVVVDATVLNEDDTPGCRCDHRGRPLSGLRPLASGLLQLRLSSQCRRTPRQILPVGVLRRQPGGRVPAVHARAAHEKRATFSAASRPSLNKCICESYLDSTLLPLAKLGANRGQPPDPYPPLSRFRIAHRVCRRSNRDATAYMPMPIAAITRSAAK